MARHPDIVALRERYDLAADTPRGWTVEGLTVLAGAYAAVSPWIIGFSGRASALAVNNLIIGLMAAMLGAGIAVAYSRTHGMAWVLPVMGLWLILAPWLVQGITRTTGTVVSNVVIGAVLVVLGLGMTAMARMGMSRSTPST